ncbi:hypothetical protein M2408_003655 [Sphingobacterium sp. BIGb0165]|nr:hypothetical protein [Sphingobacterium sp. BIGb0165]
MESDVGMKVNKRKAAQKVKANQKSPAKLAGL